MAQPFEPSKEHSPRWVGPANSFRVPRCEQFLFQMRTLSLYHSGMFSPSVAALLSLPESRRTRVLQGAHHEKLSCKPARAQECTSRGAGYRAGLLRCDKPARELPASLGTESRRCRG